jgi:hypothetical protein
LRLAEEYLNSAKLKATEIRTEGSVLANQAYKNLLETVEEDIKRLDSLHTSTIRFEEKKSINEVL